MVADVLLAYKLVEARPFEYGPDIAVNARQHYLDALLAAHYTEILQVVYSRRVDKWHFSHAYHPHNRTVAEHGHHLLKLVTGSEEVRTVNLVHLHAFGYSEVLKVALLDVKLVVGVNLVHNHLYVSGFGHALHKQQTGYEQAHLDGYGEVEYYGEEERYQQHCHIALGILHKLCERAPSRHAV